MSAPKIKSKTDKERVLAEVGRLDRCGYSQYQIAAKMKATIGYRVTQPMVCQYLKMIRAGYKSQLASDRTEKVNEMLAQLREVRAAAWEAYERSQEDAEKVVDEFAAPKADDESNEKPKRRKSSSGRPGETAEQSLALLKQVVTREGRLPGNVYLNTILATLQQERELLGLDAPKQVDVRQTTTVLDWDALFGATQPLVVVESNDPVEAMILEAAKPDPAP